VIDGYYYFAMEYVDGRNLGDRVRADGPLPETRSSRSDGRSPTPWSTPTAADWCTRRQARELW